VLVSGYLKAGETVEESAVRETLEETGLAVSVSHILGSYSGATTGLNLVIVVCVCDVLSGELRRQEEELSELGWFAHDRLPDWPEEWPVKRAVSDYLRNLNSARVAKE
jgi:NAD+ diphosphatase